MRRTLFKVFVVISIFLVSLVLTPGLMTSAWSGFLFQSPPYPPPATFTPVPSPSATAVPPTITPTATPGPGGLITIGETELVFDEEGQTLQVRFVLEEPAPLAVFRVTWPGSTYSSKLIYEGEELNPEDENVSHETTATSDEWQVSNAPAGTYTVEVTAVDIGFQGEVVTVGAYVFLQGGAGNGSIRGVVFEDTNGNGGRDSGEVGVSGVKVTIDSSGDWSATFTTGSDGSYAPVNLGTAFYSAEVTVPDGYVATGPTRYEGIGIGIHGFVATGINFAISKTTTPSALPAAGAGGLTPGILTLIALATIVLVTGAYFVLRGRNQAG